MNNYSQKISVNKYLYHLTYRGTRENIFKNGLRGYTKTGRAINYEKAVFAHNSGDIKQCWYPIVMDRYEFCPPEGDFYYDNISIEMLLYLMKIDVWRIDTDIYKGEWFLDSIAEKDFDDGERYYTENGKLIKNENLYVVTFGDIPPSAINLLKFEIITEESLSRYGKLITQERFRAVLV